MGVKNLITSQHNAWIHLVATGGVVAFGLACQLSRLEWALITLAIMAVWVAEAMNTAIELLCDYTTTEHHTLIEKSKDVAAAAVLISAIGAVVIAIFVFYPHFQ